MKMIRRNKTEPGETSKKRPRGRKKGERISVKPSNAISALGTRLSLPDTILTFQDVADFLTERSGVKVGRGVVWWFAHDTEPHDPRLRRAFGLPELAEARVCPVHHKVHDRLCNTESKPRRPSLRARRKRLMLSESWRAACASMVRRL